MSVAESDLVALLVEMLPPAGDGLRTAEIAAQLDCSMWKVRRLLHRLREQGRLVETRVKVVALGGAMRSVEAYRLKAID